MLITVEVMLVTYDSSMDIHGHEWPFRRPSLFFDMGVCAVELLAANNWQDNRDTT